MAEKRPRRGHLVTDLTEALRAQISSGTYEPGDRLPSEALLCETHGVSRTVIREAIAALRADGLVEPRQGSGVYVLEGRRNSDLPFQNLDFERVSSVVEVLELRTALESEAAALAAVRRSPGQEEALLDRLNAFLAAQNEGRPTAQTDFELHLEIAAASNNGRFVEFLKLLGPQVIPRLALQPPGSDARSDGKYLSRLAQEHRRIVDAILDGDADAARQAMREHLAGSLARYRSVLRARPVQPS